MEDILPKKPKTTLQYLYCVYPTTVMKTAMKVQLHGAIFYCSVDF